MITFLLCEKFGAILLVLVGLTAGRPAGKQSDEIREDRNPLLIKLLGILRRLRRYTCSVIVVLPMHFSWLFQVKYIVRRVVEARKSGTPCFLGTYIIDIIQW